MANRAGASAGAGAGASREDYGHIPRTIRDKAVNFSCADVVMSANQLIPTVFIGHTGPEYPDEHWDDNVNRVKTLLCIPDNSCLPVKVVSQQGNNERVDNVKLGNDITDALALLNQDASYPAIRIVRVGVASSAALSMAIEALVRGWSVPFSAKHVQFISLGDSSDRDWLNFARNLCLYQIANTVQFYNTMDYNVFGFLERRNEGLAKQSQEVIEALAKLQAGELPKSKGSK